MALLNLIHAMAAHILIKLFAMVLLVLLDLLKRLSDA